MSQADTNVGDQLAQEVEKAAFPCIGGSKDGEAYTGANDFAPAMV
jgi:hypothetical protein